MMDTSFGQYLVLPAKWLVYLLVPIHEHESICNRCHEWDECIPRSQCYDPSVVAFLIVELVAILCRSGPESKESGKSFWFQDGENYRPKIALQCYPILHDL